MKKILMLLVFLCVTTLSAQEYFPSNTGVKTSKNKLFAFTNAKIYASPTYIIKKGTLLIKDGKVLNIGKSVKIPKGTEIINLKGKTIYPSFVDVYSTFGVTAPKRKSGRGPQYDSSRKGYYWNDHIRPDTDAFEVFSFDNKKAKELVNLGFGVVNTHQNDGIMQGNGVFVALNSV